ncbi:MAG: methyltransferase domain-containing protein [Candidatus Saccharibacteria bacterium]
MYIAILGRQPALGTAELECVYGSEAIARFSDQSATLKADAFSIGQFGGIQKAGRVVAEIHGDWRRVSQKIVTEYTNTWSNFDGKITLGISTYGFDVSTREIQKTGIVLKQKLKKSGVSLRLIPNPGLTLNTAISHHNKLGLSHNKVELLVVRGRNGKVIVAESTGAQNITAYTKRDQERPKRDAFVGMLPPKLAQIMINLARPQQVAVVGAAPVNEPLRILDPFCGTGVVLQEAALMGYSVYGTDLADKMVDFSRTNLKWLANTHRVEVNSTLEQGDAMDMKWQQPIDSVVGESYLGQPFSAPPSPTKLSEVRRNCDHIISSFLRNISGQLKSGTPLCIAIPAWKDINGTFTHLSLIEKLDDLGFEKHKFKLVSPDDLLYFREDQVVARELLVLIKA